MDSLCQNLPHGNCRICGAALKCHTPDSAILQAISSGDRVAFWFLWRRLEPDIYRVCLTQMNGNHADAEDALGAMRLRAFHTLPLNAAAIREPRSWLMKATRNFCRDLMRCKVRCSSRETMLDGNSLEIVDPRPGTRPDLAISGDGLPMRLLAAIDGLSPRLREAVILRFHTEASYAEIARVQAITEVNARKRVQQARVAIRHAVHADEFGRNPEFTNGVDRRARSGRGR